MIPPATPWLCPGNNIYSAIPAGICSGSCRQCTTDNTLTFAFARPIDPVSLMSALTISPTVAGEYALDGNTFIFTPTDRYFAPNTTYQVELTPTVLSPEGKTLLLEPVLFSFTTDYLDRQINFGWGTHVQVVDTDGRRALQFQTDLDQGDITLELFSLSESEFFALYPTALDWNLRLTPSTMDANLALVRSWEMALDPAQLAQYEGIGEMLIPADVPTGLYLLNIRRGYNQDQLLIVLSHTTW
ncbi:MAG: Ig-like domain-containing protein [Chloroflexi bacterium]|nr:Ig-like domain-containing protein [Chloroflexota bacterium]